MTEIITVFFSISLDVAKAGIPSRDGNGVPFPSFWACQTYPLCLNTVPPTPRLRLLVLDKPHKKGVFSPECDAQMAIWIAYSWIDRPYL